jgi:NlpC/P60 family
LIGQQNREPLEAAYSATPKTKDVARHAQTSVTRVLTADEGLAVLGAALESRAHPDFKSDCSHLVHAIYERAGFPYAYVNSLTLYEGRAEFRRVAHPQPGDLVVWPGHVGIAVNPAQHSFFSALRSGLGVAYYDSSYWRERGRPRFFRYSTDAPATIPVVPSSGEANLQAAASPELNPPVAQNAAFTADEALLPHADSARTSISVVQINNAQSPSPKEVTDALERAFSETGEALRGQDVVKPPRPMIVFDQLSIERVHLQRDRGWAEIRINGAFDLPGREGTTSTKRTERQRWPLVRRDHDGWELSLPQEAIYVRNDVALRMLARQLVALTNETAGQSSTPEEKVEVSRLLSVLLEKQPGPGE